MFLIRKLIRLLAILLNWLAIIWIILCSYASTKDPAGVATLWSLWSFTTFFALITNAFFLVFWLFTKKKWRILYSFLALVFTHNTWEPILAWNYFGSNKTKATEKGIKILSWNVHLFDLGELTEDETSKAKIIQYLEKEQPDILVLQEYYWDTKANSLPYTEIIQQLGYPYVALATESKMHKSTMNIRAGKGEIIDVGLAIFSKFPIEQEKVFNLSHNDYKLLYTEISIDETHSIDLATVHLTSTGIKPKDIEYIDEVKSKYTAAIEKSPLKRIIKSLMYASAERSVLANDIDSLKIHFENPLIICGDFNDIPSSYSYRKIKGNMGDAFISKGVGLGRTFDKIFPTLRIDYILYDKENLKAEGFYKEDIGLSDHYPISANFSFKK